MKLYLNAGFGRLIGKQDLDLIDSLGFDGVRQDVLTRQDARALCSEFVKGPLEAIFIVRDVETARAVADSFPAPTIEAGNELDIAGWSPDKFADFVRRVEAAVPQGRIISGGVSNLSREAQKWLTKAQLSPRVGIGYHSYRTTVPATTPLKGFTSRDAELGSLKVIANGRDIYCTETGWHTAESRVKVGWFRSRKVRFTDEQVAEFTLQEIEVHRRNGAKCVVLFQLNDGPNPKVYEHRFGIRRQDGTPKPVALAVQALAREWRAVPA